MKTIMVIAAFCLIAVIGCQPAPVVIQQQPGQQPQNTKETIIIERDRAKPCPPPARPVTPPCPPPHCPPPSRPGVNIEIDINKPHHHHHCSPGHRCGRCDWCRKNGIKIEIGR